MQRSDSKNTILQKTLGITQSKLFLPLLLLVMSTYPPLSTDMYLPSLPDIITTFNCSEATINLTLVLFFVFFAFATLIWGPISDKFGRKIPLMTGISLYILASAGCIWSGSVTQLIFWRIVQALAAGAPVTISIAIVQDTYSGNSRKKMLSTLTALMMVAPVAAPTLGSLVLMIAEWRMIFTLLMILGIVSLAGCFCIKESIPEKTDASVFRTFGSLFHVLRDDYFKKALTAFSIPALYVLGFVGVSALIFMNEFGVSSTFFSICFASNAVFAIIGACLYVPLLRWLSIEKIIIISFLTISLSGVLILCFGQMNAITFLVCVIPGTLMAALLRPLSVDLLMDAGGRESGAASSMINFFFTIIGSIGMQILSLSWDSRVMVYGIMAVLTGGVCLLVWTRVHHKEATAVCDNC